MTDPEFTLRYTPSAALSVAAMKTPSKGILPSVKGARWAVVIKLVQCVMMGLGSVGFGFVAEYLLTGQTKWSIWPIAVGIVLFYVAVFGSIFVSLPVMVRSVLSTKLNRGEVTLTLNAEGLASRTDHFHSLVKWSGIEGMTRNKLALVIFAGSNRVSLPFAAMDGGEAQADDIERAVADWIGAAQ